MSLDYQNKPDRASNDKPYFEVQSNSRGWFDLEKNFLDLWGDSKKNFSNKDTLKLEVP